ncbi:unnamed protein product [Phytophthora fragariaefolia]|uniref:Unnamed protein product n=1 Tax=Phytophthora fragariaefolia TaxID=1490495 RepID=A0A9W6TNE9_9STRA|nr:unnamed protein product [Phytophthora fragariaefolia]
MDRARRTRRRQDKPRTPAAMKASVAAAMLLLIQGNVVAGQSCELAASTLSTTCDDACSQYVPCVAYNAAVCPAGATCVAADQCAIQCFSKSVENTESFTFLMEFGSYESSKEQEEKAGSAQVNDVPDETDKYAAAIGWLGEDVVSRAMANCCWLFPSVLAGGSNTNSSVKGKVAKVTFGSDVISAQANVTNVVLHNLDLSTPATLQQIPVVLPSSLQNLSLTNTLLSEFPILVANFTSLQNL